MNIERCKTVALNDASFVETTSPSNTYLRVEWGDNVCDVPTKDTFLYKVNNNETLVSTEKDRATQAEADLDAQIKQVISDFDSKLKAGTGNKSAILNDVENNTAISENSLSTGTTTMAGSKAFLITACDQENKTFTLDSVVGLEVGDLYSISAVGYANVEDIAEITEINGNEVKVEHLPVEGDVTYGNAVASSDKLPANFPEGLDAPYFRVVKKPNIGTQTIGTAAFASGYDTQAQMVASLATNYYNVAAGKYSIAMGRENTAYYAAIAAGGSKNTAFGKNSGVIAGAGNKVNSYAGFIAGGQNNVVSGVCGFAQGSLQDVSGFNASAFGLGNHIYGKNDFGSGFNNTVNGYCATAFGDRNTNIGLSCLAAGMQNFVGTKGFKILSATANTDGTGVFKLDSVEGLVKDHAFSTIQDKNFDNWGTITDINTSDNTVTVSKFTETTVPEDSVFIDLNDPKVGTQTVTVGAAGFGIANRAIGRGSIVAGEQNYAYGRYAAVFGRLNKGVYGTTVGGRENTVLGQYSTAFGWVNTLQSGARFCFMVGEHNSAENASACLIAGSVNNISGTDADKPITNGVALGGYNKVTMHYGVALGYNNIAGTQSFAVGASNNADGWLRFAIGEGLKVSNDRQVIVGTYNKPQLGAAFIVGNGTSDTARSNAFVVNKDGSAEVGKQGTKDLSVATIKPIKDFAKSISTATDLDAVKAAAAILLAALGGSSQDVEIDVGELD